MGSRDFAGFEGFGFRSGLRMEQIGSFLFFFSSIPSSHEGVSGEVEMGVEGFDRGLFGILWRANGWVQV